MAWRIDHYSKAGTAAADSGEDPIGRNHRAKSAVPIAEFSLILEATGEKYDYSIQVGHLLRKAYQKHTATFQRMCIDRKLTSIQLAVLCALAEEGPASLTTLGRATAIGPATIRGVVERLGRRDFVRLQPDPTDGRKVIVVLSEAGHNLIIRMLPYLFEISRRTLHGLTNVEQLAFSHLLMKIGR